MRRVPFCSVVVAALLIACAFAPVAPSAVAQDDQQVTLAWKFKAGETSNWKLTEVASEETTDRSESVTQKQTTTIYWTQKVEKVDGDVATLNIKYTRVVYEQQTSLNSATPVKFDSKNPEDMQRAESDLALRPFRALVANDGFTVRIKPNGEVVEVKGYSDMLEKMFDGLNDDIFVQLKAALKTQFSDEAMKDQLGQLWRVLPDGPVTVGKRWNRLVTQPVMFVGKLKADQDFRLESVDTAEGQPPVAKVSVSTIYSSEDDGSATPPGADALEGFKISGSEWGGEQKGSVEFDINAGRIKKSTLESTMNVHLEASSTSMAESTKLTWDSKVTSTVTLEQVTE